MKHFVLLGMILSSALAFAGPRVVKNGGDMYAIEFLGIGQQVLKSLESHKLKTKVDLKKLAKVIDESTVESVATPLKLDGVDKDAINYPQAKRIVFNRLTWAGQELSAKAILVLHEYFGIAGVDDKKYQVSTALIEEIAYGKVSYNGEVYDRKLSKEEVRKLLPIYLNFVLSKAKETPSTRDKEALRTIELAAGTPKMKVPGGEGSQSYDIKRIKDWIESGVQDLNAITVDERVESTKYMVDGFKEGKGRITCELGYENVTRWKTERIVKCDDDRSMPEKDGEEGWTDIRTFILSIDGTTLEPLGVLSLDVLQAG